MNVLEVDFVRLSRWLRRSAPLTVCYLTGQVYASQHHWGRRFVKEFFSVVRTFVHPTNSPPFHTSGCTMVPAVSAALWLSALTAQLLAQTTIGTGSIVGTVGDPSGTMISGAIVRITNEATGQAINLTSNSSGTFNSGALIPGNYTTKVYGRKVPPCGGLSNRARG
jgi:hypothetical protein